MPIHYLLPCDGCEHQFQLTTSQAGQPQGCPQCGATIDAPKLGTLKQLPTSVHSEAAASQGEVGWKRYVFAMGLMTAVAAGIAGGALYWYSQSLFTPVDVESHIEMVQQDIDQFSPAELWYNWHHPTVQQQLEDGLGEWFEPEYMGKNIQSNHLKNFSYGLLGLAGLGVLMLLSSFAMKR